MVSTKAPTKAQIEKGPIVNLHNAEWASDQFDLEGFCYPVAFDANGNTIVLLSDYKEFGDNRARELGIVVDKPAPAKPEAAAHKKPAKKPAAKKSVAKTTKVRKKNK